MESERLCATSSASCPGWEGRGHMRRPGGCLCWCLWYWWGCGQSFDLIYLLIPCLSVPSHMARCGRREMETLKVKERGRRINTLKRIQSSLVTSIMFFWWQINHDWVCVYASLCIKEHVLVSPCKELCLWGDITLGRCLISDCETSQVTNTESCKVRVLRLIGHRS